MKVTLTKNILLHSAQAYLRFQKEVERKDIQEYLNGKKRFEQLIENRIKDYLKNIGVFDEKYQLTRLGNTVKETAKMFVYEEGKYQIFYTQDDSFFDNRILYFRRLQPNAIDKIHQYIFIEREGHFFLPTYENKYINFNLDTDKICANIDENKYQIHFSWIWENLEKSYYVFNGEIGNKDRKTKIKAEPIPSDKNLQEMITKILPEWDVTHNRYKIRFNDIQDDDSKKIFEHKTFDHKWFDFEVKFQNLPIMPYDEQNAIEWRNFLLDEELILSYYSSHDFEKKVTEINEKYPLSIFHLSTIELQEYVKKLEKIKQAYWHLQAPIDLNPKL